MNRSCREVMVLIAAALALAVAPAMAQLGMPGGNTPAPAPDKPDEPGEEAEASPEDAASAAEEAARRERLLKPGARDPFWPIGYVPPPPAPAFTNIAPPRAVLPDEDWKSARRQLKVAAISRRGARKHLALLRDGSLVTAGDVVTVRDKVYIYKFRITAINQRGIEAMPLAATPVDEE